MSAGLRRAWGGVVLFMVLSGLFLSASAVRAHALLVRSVPEAGAELTSAPATIELWFSEPLEPAFSLAYLVDAQGNEIRRGASAVDGADPMHLTLTLTALPPGIYTVVYRNLSQADGHEWVGSFPLTLLNPDGSRPSGSAAVVDHTQSNELPLPLKAVSRWLALLGAMLLTGLLVFQRIEGSNAPLQKSDTPITPPVPAFRALIDSSVRVGLVLGIGLVFIGGWLQVLAQMTVLDSTGNTGGIALDLFFLTRAGSLLVARQILVGGLLLITIVAINLSGKLQVAGHWLALLLSLAILATFSIGSHAAAVAGSNWAILGDFVHLVAAAIWLGGLLLLAVLLWQRRAQPAVDTPLLRQVVQRFSAVATVAVFVLVVTGLFSSFVQVQSLSSLWTTTYGRLLSLKVLLVGVTLGIALLNNRLVHGKRESATALPWTETHYRPFLRQVWSESLSGLVLMVVVALLVQTPVPPPPAPPAPETASLFQTILSADDLTMHLQITPNQVGENRYTIHLSHANGSAIGEVQLVRLLFEHQTADLGQATLDLAAQGGDLFAAAGAYQNRAGVWDVSVYVRRRGMDDVLVPTTVEVPAPPAPTTTARDPWQNPIATLPGALVVAGIIVALGLAPLIWWRATQA